MRRRFVRSISIMLIASLISVGMLFPVVADENDMPVPVLLSEEEAADITWVESVDADSEEILEEAEIEAAQEEDGLMVSRTAPITGKYVFMFNRTTPDTGSSVSVGTLPSYMMEEYEDDEAFIENTNDEPIMGYDEDGGVILDGSATLEEPIVDYDLIDQYGEELEELEAANYSVGDVKILDLRVGAQGSPNEQQKKNCVCISVGEHCTVWVPIDDPIYQYSSVKMTGYMDEVRDNFEGNYQKVVDGFGSFSPADEYGDKDGKVALICYDINSDGDYANAYIGGYFWAADLNVNYSNASGNKMDCVHIDSAQAMNRTGYKLGNVAKSMGTAMHELQHMVMWGNLRTAEKRNGATFLQYGVPSWINEGFSEAANQLCNNYTPLSSRISCFNMYHDIYQNTVGVYSSWSTGDTLYRYALSYLFMQYVRTRYAQTSRGMDADGWNIYRDALNRVGKTSNNEYSSDSMALLNAMADCIGTSTTDLVESFWIAMYAKKPTGKYGFNGDRIADMVNLKTARSSRTTLAAGCVQMLPFSGAYTPSGKDSAIDVIGVDKDAVIPSVQVRFEVGERYGMKVIKPIPVSPEDAQIYLNVNAFSAAPTESDTNVTNQDIGLNVAYNYHLAFLAVDPNHVYQSTVATKDVTVLESATPEISYVNDPNNKENCIVTIKSSDADKWLLFTVDGTTPTLSERSYLYEQNFIVPKNTTVKAASAAMGKSISGVVTATTSRILPKPSLSAATFSMNKRIAPEYRKVSLNLSSTSNDLYGQCTLTGSGSENFLLSRDSASRNDWTISINNSGLAAKVYYLTLNVPKGESSGGGYFDYPIRITVVDTPAKVTVNTPKFNFSYKPEPQPLTVSSTDGTVQILGIADGIAKGFTSNYELLDQNGDGKYDAIGVCKSTKNELVKSGSGVPITAGKLRVRVDGYDEQLVDLKVTLVDSTLKLTSLTKPNVGVGTAKVFFDLQVSGKGLATEGITKADSYIIDESQSGYKTFEKNVKPYIKTFGWNAERGQVALILQEVNGQSISAGAYTVPVRFSGKVGEKEFISCPVTLNFTVQTPQKAPKVKMSASKLILNAQAEEMQDLAFTCDRQDLYVKMEAVYTATTSKVNRDHGVQLVAESDENENLTIEKNHAIVRIDGANYQGGTSYTLLLTPKFYRVEDNQEYPVSNAKAMKLTVTVNPNAPVITTKQKGSVDVLNRNGSGITYTVKGTNFGSVSLANPYEAGAISVVSVPGDYVFGANELPGEAMFECGDPVFKVGGAGYLLKSGSVKVRAKSSAAFENGKVYVFRLKFANVPGFTAGDKSAYSPILKIKPKQSAVKFTVAKLAAFNKLYWPGDRIRTATIKPSIGSMQSVTLNPTQNEAWKDYFVVDISYASNMATVKVDLKDASLKKGTYKVYVDVVMKNALLQDGSPKVITVPVGITVK